MAPFPLLQVTMSTKILFSPSIDSQERKENKEAPQAPQKLERNEKQWKKLVWQNNNLADLRFLESFRDFVFLFALFEKVFFSVNCLFARLSWNKSFWEKKFWLSDSKFFTFFKQKNYVFGKFWDPLDFRAEGPKKIFYPFFDTMLRSPIWVWGGRW